MRLLQALCFLGIVCSSGFGKTISADAGVGNTNVLNELNKLRQTMADQQKSIAEQQKSIAEQQESIADQQGQIARQQQEIENGLMAP